MADEVKTNEQLVAEFERIAKDAKKDYDKTAAELKEAVAKSASTKTVEALEEKLKTIETKAAEITEKFEAVAKASEAHAEALGKLQATGEKEEKNKRTSFLEEAEKAYNTPEFQAMLKNMTNAGAGQKASMTMKATPFLTSGWAPAVATAAPYALTSFDQGGIKALNRRQPFLRTIMNTLPMVGEYLAWAEQLTRTGGAGTIAEGALKPELVMTVGEKTAKAETIAVWHKASKQILSSVAAFLDFIQSELRDEVELALDAQLLTGNGTSPNLKGLATFISSALSVTGTPFAVAGGGIKSANRFDILRVAAAIVAVNGVGKYSPNYALVHPYDAAQMDLVKDSTGEYTMPEFRTNDGMVVSGLKIIENVGVTQDTFFVGDFNQAQLRIREEFNVGMWFDSDDYTKNLVTVLGEMRALMYIKTNNLAAFTKGTFSTLITATSV